MDGILLGFLHRVVDGWIRIYSKDTEGKEYENDGSVTVQIFYEQPHVIAHWYK